MDIKLTKLPKSKVKLDITEDATKVKRYFNEAYDRLVSTVDIKGFRPGKAPRMLTIETIGRGKYNSEALNLALPQVYSAAVKEKKLVPVGSPKVNIISFGEDKPFHFEAEIDLLPEIKLGDYKKIKISYKKPKIEVKKEEVEKVVKRLAHQSAQYTVTADKAKKGDRMEISFTGKVKNIIKDKYTSKNYPFILGERVLMPKFEEKLIGAKKGDKKEFLLEVKSKSVGKNGKIRIEKEKVDFEITVNEVWHVKLPELDQDFAKKFGHKNMSDLRLAIQKSIKQEKEQRERQILETKVLDEVLKKVEIEVPESLLEQEVDRRVEMIKKQTGPAFGKYLENIGKSLVELRSDIRPNAQKGVRISLALNEISKDMEHFDPKLLGTDMKKNHQIQQEAVKKTLDKLIEIATK